MHSRGRQAGRQAGRQVYVVADDERQLFRDASLPQVLADRIVDPASFLSDLLAGRVAAAIVSTRAATPEFAGALARLRAAGVPIALVELTPADARLSVPRAAWADAAVKSVHAHRTLVPVTRSALISRVCAAAGRVLRVRVRPGSKADVVLCGLFEHRPAHESIAALAQRTRVPKRTLERHFELLLVPNEYADGAEAPELVTCVRWLLLLSALEARPAGHSWEEIARSHYTTSSRLGRLSQALCGTELDILDREEIVLPVRAFEENFLPWLGVKLAWGVAV